MEPTSARRQRGAEEVRQLGPSMRFVHRVGVIALAVLVAAAYGLLIERWSGTPTAIRTGVVAFLGVYFTVSIPLHDLTDEWFEPPLHVPRRSQLRWHARGLWACVASLGVAVGLGLGEVVPAWVPAIAAPLATQVVLGQLVRIRRPEVDRHTWVPFARWALLLSVAPPALHLLFRAWEPLEFPWNAVSTTAYVVVFLLLIGRVGNDALALERYYRSDDADGSSAARRAPGSAG